MVLEPGVVLELRVALEPEVGKGVLEPGVVLEPEMGRGFRNLGWFWNLALPSLEI